MTVKSQTLKVPGAQIHYEIHGSGPILWMIAGGPADAAAFTEPVVFPGDHGGYSSQPVAFAERLDRVLKS